MLDRFELIQDEKTPFLTFKGFFDPGQFPHIQISPRNSKTETSVLLPNTLINSILLPEREVTSFSEEGILEKMLLEEKITKKENGKINNIDAIIICEKPKISDYSQLMQENIAKILNINTKRNV